MTAYEMRISDWSSDVCSSDLFQLWVDRDINQRTGLVLADGDPVSLHVLPAHLNGIRFTLPRVEHERHGEPRLSADRVVRFELGDLFFRPRDRKSTRLNSSH